MWIQKIIGLAGAIALLIGLSQFYDFAGNTETDQLSSGLVFVSVVGLIGSLFDLVFPRDESPHGTQALIYHLGFMIPTWLCVFVLGNLGMSDIFENPIFIFEFKKVNYFEFQTVWMIILAKIFYDYLWLLKLGGAECLVAIERRKNTMEAWRSTPHKMVANYSRNLLLLSGWIFCLFLFFEYQDTVLRYLIESGIL
ncbi:MAG: hypothetical protein ACPGVO_04315 [Spirulinaceae cyanobacterium]